MINVITNKGLEENLSIGWDDETHLLSTVLYEISGIIGSTKSEVLWNVCRIISSVDEEENLFRARVGNIHGIQLVRLSPHVRRVATIHSCEMTCGLYTVRRTMVVQRAIAFEGGTFQVVQRHEV